MSSRKRRRVELDKDVYTAAQERISLAYDVHDQLVVGFSGGKDSTVCLEMVVEEARRRGKLPVPAIFFDEEAIPYETEHYVRRRYQSDEVEVHWYSVPVRHLNACSKKQPFWSCWDPDEEHLWCRSMPPESITWRDDKHLMRRLNPERQTVAERPTIPSTTPYVMINFTERFGVIGFVMGIRTAESMARYRNVRGLYENFMTGVGQHGEATYRHVYPIYDWQHEDVWRAIVQNGWDYNEAYDIMEAAGMTLAEQRCAPPYGAEPIRGLWRFKSCHPELWDKMVERVPGANTAAMYAREGFYSAVLKPEGATWEDYIRDELEKFGEPMRTVMAKRIKAELSKHYRRTDDPILDSVPHPETGVSWGRLAHLAVRGDFKSRKTLLRAQPGTEEQSWATYLAEREKLADSGKLPRRGRYVG